MTSFVLEPNDATSIEKAFIKCQNEINKIESLLINEKFLISAPKKLIKDMKTNLDNLKRSKKIISDHIQDWICLNNKKDIL